MTMNFQHQTSSAETPDSIRTNITIQTILPSGAAVGVVEHDGLAAYVSRNAMQSQQADLGDTFAALIAPNELPGSKIKWYTRRLVERASAGLPHGVLDKIAATLRSGGVWKPADFKQVDQTAAAVALETIYRKGGVSKFVRFDDPNSPGVDVWYTAYPDRADVDEFEEDDWRQE